MGWTVLGASVAGTSHRSRVLPCQDAFRYRVFGPTSEWLALIAADGAGSASRSEIGAAAACDELLNQVEKVELAASPDRDQAVGMFAAARSALFAKAVQLEVEPRELACTALLAIVGPTTAIFAQIGDGAIVVGTGQAHRVVFWPEPGEYANMTDFLTDDSYENRIRFESLPEGIDEIAVLTDGLQRLALDYAVRDAHPDFFGPLFRVLRDAADPEALSEPFQQFLDSGRVNERTDDDKTLVIAIRRP